MPRDGSGNYTLPGGINPVITGTTIDVAWANPTADDIAAALTDSLSRTGSGGMLVPFLNADGAIGSPGISWVNEPSMGIYRPNANEMRVPITGVDRGRWVSDVNPMQVWIVSDASWRPLLNTFNPYTIIGDWVFEGALVTDDSTTARAGFNIPLGVEPTVPLEGDMWKTAGDAFIYTGAAVHSIIGANQSVSTTEFAMLTANASAGWDETTALLLNNGSLFFLGKATAESDLINTGQLWAFDDGFAQSLKYTTETGLEFLLAAINQSDINPANVAVAGAAPSWSEILVSQPDANEKYVFQCTFQASFAATDDMNVQLVIDTLSTFSGTISWVGGGSTPGSEGLHSAVGEVITNIVAIDTDGSVSPDGVYVTIIGTLINGNQSTTTMSLRVSKQADVGANGIVYLGAGMSYRSVQSFS